MSTEITSPPWPTDTTRVDTLFDVLRELHRWAAGYREAINAASDHQAIPPLRDVPRKAVHDALPVVYHYANYVAVRRVRELWDALVRDHEESWDVQAAFVRRRQLVAVCVDFLNNAWLSQEAREARAAAAQDQFMKDSVAKSFGFLIGPVPSDPPDLYPGG